MDHGIAETGMTVGYEPSEGEPVADIVFVHGLQGHPHRTWTATNVHPAPATGSRPLSLFRGTFSRLVSKSAGTEVSSPDGDTPSDNEGEQPSGSEHRSVFWPVDFLPGECPNSRVLLYGYDTRITKLTTGAPDRGSTFSHGKDLLFALSRVRTPGRPLIFVAHSLGGIVVKEMLSSSDASGEPGLKDIIKSTAAIVFLGTPHRGSPELVSLAEWARVLVHTLRFQSSWVIMDVLGLKTTDLERTQEAFSRLWQTYGFQVKTFQEGMGLTGFRLGSIGNKVVPDHSSLIGDSRERAETIRANHRDMCRFVSRDDPNYRRVIGELESVYLSTRKACLPKAGPGTTSQCDELALPKEPSTCGAAQDSCNGTGLSETQRACLRVLSFPNMNARYQEVDNPAEGTCRWMFAKSSQFTDWVTGNLTSIHEPFLWIKGKPGSGKSVLMKEAHRRISAGDTSSLYPARGLRTPENYCTAAFFFNSKGDELARSRVGFFRSLLYQLLPHHPEYFRELSEEWAERLQDWEQGVPMQEASLRNALRGIFHVTSTEKTYIFVDALDECGNGDDTRYLFGFCEAMARTARLKGVSVSFCVSSRQFPTTWIGSSLQIILDEHNGADIRSYVESKIRKGIFTEQRRQRLINSIDEKSCGVFLWASLVVDDILRLWDEGRNMGYIVKHLDKLPKQLDGLYMDILASMSGRELGLATRLFQWAILSTEPLRIREWHHVMAFIKQPAPLSLREWRLSDEYTEDDEQLTKRIRHVSRGLVEVRSRMDEASSDAVEVMSIRAKAGSLSLGTGETRVVQVIHESVREFFLQRESMDLSWERAGHVSIMMTCLDYLDIAELDGLVQARMNADRSAKSNPGTESGSEPISVDVASDKPQAHSTNDTDESRPYIDTIEWLSTIQTTVEGPDKPPRPQSSHSDAASNTDEKTHVLEDYPALLSYAAFQLFTHARRAEECRGDPKPVIQRLRQPAVWNRWVALREDIPLDTKPLHYVSNLSLPSWVRELDEGRTDDAVKAVSKTRRSPSVASFSSASSHASMSVNPFRYG